MFIIGKKLGMTRIFQEDGTVVPVTVVAVEPLVIAKVKTQDKDGYDAVQYAFGTAKKPGKRAQGEARGLAAAPAGYREFRTEAPNGQRGEIVNLSDLNVGSLIKVTGFSKAKGFQGAMKRHGFSGLPASHGHKAVKRHVGSIGQRFPQHTLKGSRGPGRMSAKRTTVRGLKVVNVDTQANHIAIKGAVPGRIGGLLMITTL